jgi:hypothetical protein
MTTTIKLLSFGLLFATVATSCKKEEETPVSDTPKEIILPRVQQIPTETYVPPQQVAQPQQPITPANQVAPPPPPVVTKAGMNPPHGQPGHRCDIKVGEPLSTPVAANTAKPGTANTKQISIPTSNNPTPFVLDPDAAKTVTAPGTNPPHGEEGHQCGIPVGAELPK